MLSSRGSSTLNTGASPATVTGVSPPGLQSYVVVSVALANTTDAITSITMGTGTFVRAAAVNSTHRLEVWIGYNFGSSNPTSLTVNHTNGINIAAVIRTLDCYGSASAAPVFNNSAGSTATSASADSGSVTPAVGDILVATMVLTNSGINSSARIHTGNAYLENTAIGASGPGRVETGYNEAATAVASKEVWTLSASGEWVAVQVSWTPGSPPAPTPALLLKGLTTQAADAASSF